MTMATTAIMAIATNRPDVITNNRSRLIGLMCKELFYEYLTAGNTRRVELMVYIQIKPAPFFQQ
jgi:hypothetical protein